MAPPYEKIDTYTKYGLNTFGCNSTVLMKDGNVYGFQYFGNNGSQDIYYVQYDDNGNLMDENHYGRWFTLEQFKGNVVSEVFLKKLK
jgi:hypothetical protein